MGNVRVATGYDPGPFITSVLEAADVQDRLREKERLEAEQSRLRAKRQAAAYQQAQLEVRWRQVESAPLSHHERQVCQALIARHGWTVELAQQHVIRSRPAAPVRS